MKSFNNEPLPPIPPEVLEDAQKNGQQVYCVHLLHPDKEEIVHYLSLAGFLPREGDLLCVGNFDEKYDVRTVTHLLEPNVIGGTVAYTTKAHVFCAPANRAA